MDNEHVVKETTLTEEKKHLAVVVLYHNSINVKTRTKLKTTTRLGIRLYLKDRISKDLTPGDYAMNPIMVNTLDTFM